VILDCPCGERLVAADPDELVEQARKHLAREHPGMDYTREEILAIARRS
jgi:hypothetical protein